MMNFKRVLVIAIMVLFAICIASSVQAEDGEIIHIGDLDFNIPAGFEKSEFCDENNVSKVNGIETVSNTLIYSGPDGLISIMTIDYNDEVFEELINDGEKSTMKDIDGYMFKENGEYIFKYIHNDTLVEVSAPNKELIESILVK